MMPRRNPEEIWRKLVEEAGEDEIDRAASVSVAQAEKELAAAGFDVAAERAKAAALLGELESGPPVPGQVAVPAAGHPASGGAVRSSARRRRSLVVWLSAAAAAAAAGAVLYVTVPAGVSSPRPVPPSAGPSTGPASPLDRAVALRRQALAACDAKQFAVCEAKLDEARRLDAAGESDPRVQDARRAIEPWRRAQDR